MFRILAVETECSLFLKFMILGGMERERGQVFNVDLTLYILPDIGEVISLEIGLFLSKRELGE